MAAPAPALPLPFTLVRHERLGSTNDEAARLAAGGAPEGTVVQADVQTAGRGRRGRSWISPPGNLYCSLILRPDRPPAEAAGLSFAAALAVAEAVAPALPAGTGTAVKWPNDVLVGGRKAAGLLLESAARDGRLEWLVLGLGVNLAHHPEGLPFPATSLAAAGARGITVDGLLEAFCRQFAAWYDTWRRRGFAPVRTAWLARAARLDEPIEVRLAAETLEGRFADLDADGALVLETAEGRRRITAGDVFFPAGAAGRNG